MSFVRARTGYAALTSISLIGLLLVGCEANDDRSTSPPEAATLREGDVAPGFELPSVAGRDIRLADYRGQKAVLLYFSMGPG